VGVDVGHAGGFVYLHRKTPLFSLFDNGQKPIAKKFAE
jgi:hypothetical protein